MMSDEIFQKNRIREGIKNFFCDLDCHTFVRPVSKESQLAHIEELDYEKDLRPEFRTAMDALMNKLKSPDSVKVKSVNGKALTSSMLLGMAMEYVDAINNQEIPVVMNCFDRVVQVESRRFTEKLFEEMTHRIRQECDEALMPFEEDDSILIQHISYADRRLAEQLGDVASVESLIDWREDFEKRLRSYFKETIRESNKLISRHHCMNLLQTLAVARPIASKLRLSDVKDIDATAMDKVRLECTSIFQEYLKGAKGPSKSEALAEFFQTWVIDSELTDMLKTIDTTFESASNRVKLMLNETQRQEGRLTSLID